MARRCVGSLGVTSTIRARPNGSVWVRPRSGINASLREVTRRAPKRQARAPTERSAADLAHAPSRAYEVDLADRMARPLCGNFCRDRFREVVIGTPAAQDRAEVTLADG